MKINYLYLLFSNDIIVDLDPAGANANFANILIFGSLAKFAFKVNFCIFP